MNKYLFLFATCFALASCNSNGGSECNSKMTETERYYAWMDSIRGAYMDEDPVWQSYEGIKKDYGDWTIRTDERAKELLDRSLAELKFMKANFDFEALDEQGKITYRLYEDNTLRDQRNFKFRHHSYPVNQMFGTHSWVPSFMINIHTVDSLSDAEAYLSRLESSSKVFDQLMVNLRTRDEMGIIPPKFIFPKVKDACQNIISGAPFDGSEEACPLLADFTSKVDSLDISNEKKEELIDRAEEALIKVLKPSYEALISFLDDWEKRATDEAGVWKFPEGGAYYASALEQTTTTNMTPEEIFDTGMQEIKRIHSEMEQIKEAVGFDGDLEAFFDHVLNGDAYYYENTDKGREAYLDDTHVMIDAMRDKLDELFITKPKAELTIKRVEAFREKFAGSAFYQSATPDGSRPGIYYVNLYNMKNQPKYQMEALAYHEAIPGHHMQLSIAQELEGLPKFRTMDGGYTAYTEGWGLYSEYLPKEYGFYEDPYSDFGRLAMELWRACRLVVDVGIHSKKWTRQEAIDFYDKNTPDPLNECIRMVDRHIVMPSQATAYKIGQLKILELREMAKSELGDAFDIRDFHEVVLTSGEVPLNVLEEMVKEYIASKKAA